MKIKVRRETARCTNCGKINEFYYLSDFLYGERLVIFHNGMSYAYINLLEDDVYNDFIDKVKTILNLHQKEFSEEKLQNLFETGTYNNSRSSDSRKGMGIGLSICKTIITAHHGTLNGRNHADGAEFCFTLPKSVDVASEK